MTWWDWPKRKILQLTLMPAVCTTFPHFTISLPIKAANSSGVLPIRIAPWGASFSCTSGAFMAAIAAQMVDAFGNPGWQFSEVGVFFWLVLGIGVAASRPRAEREAEEAVAALEAQRAPVMKPSRRWAVIPAVRLGNRRR